jgi:hypothetical protein
MALYLEDFAAGQTFVSGSARVEPEAVARFAMEFDPQPSTSMRTPPGNRSFAVLRPVAGTPPL